MTNDARWAKALTEGILERNPHLVGPTTRAQAEARAREHAFGEGRGVAEPELTESELRAMWGDR